MSYLNKAGTTVVVGVAAVLFSSASVAQLSDKPGFYFSVKANFTSDNNIFRQASAKKSDSILTISPEILFIKGFGKHKFSAEYLGDFASYGKNTTENFTDHFVNFDLLFDLSRKFKVDLQANYNQRHESRDSSGAVQNSSVAHNQLAESRIFSSLAYGRKEATAQVEVDVAIANTKFTNNNQSFRDRKATTVSGRVYYNLGNKTAVFAEVKQNVLDYLSSGTRNRDSNESFYHIGARWDASNKISGELRLGSYEKKFSSATETNGKGASYDANILWEPKTYSHFTLGLSRRPEEATTTDSFYISNTVSVDWEHNFNKKLTLNMNMSNGTDEYSGTRKDQLLNAGLGFSYKFRRWMKVGLDYKYSKRDSTDNTADYTDNLIMLTATISKL